MTDMKRKGKKKLEREELSNMGEGTISSFMLAKKEEQRALKCKYGLTLFFSEK